MGGQPGQAGLVLTLGRFLQLTGSLYRLVRRHDVDTADHRRSVHIAHNVVGSGTRRGVNHGRVRRIPLAASRRWVDEDWGGDPEADVIGDVVSHARVLAGAPARGARLEPEVRALPPTRSRKVGLDDPARE